MKMRKTRGAALQTADERSRGRRIRKAPVPDLNPTPPPPRPEELIKAYNRLAYAMRKGFSRPWVKKQVGRALLCLKTRESPPPAPPAAHKPKFPHPRPLRHQPIKFTPAKDPAPPAGLPSVREKARRAAGGVLRAREVPRLGYDPRVFNSEFEHPLVLRYRRAQWDLKAGLRSADFTAEEAELFYADPVIRYCAKYAPNDTLIHFMAPAPDVCCSLQLPEYPHMSWPRARISDYEISVALSTLAESSKAPPTVSDETRALVRKDAWNELDARLANLENYQPVTRHSALEAAGWYGETSFPPDSASEPVRDMEVAPDPSPSFADLHSPACGHVDGEACNARCDIYRCLTCSKSAPARPAFDWDF